MTDDTIDLELLRAALEVEFGETAKTEVAMTMADALQRLDRDDRIAVLRWLEANVTKDDLQRRIHELGQRITRTRRQLNLPPKG